ncbi:MAG: LPS export ABC transporter permease LptF [Neisseria sp.]|nr:LPS export ABC transporter permease LptF [Neisseria sp.]
MIYRRQLIKELTLTAVGIFFVLLAILVSTQIINLLGRVAVGRVALDAVGTLLAVWMLGLTPLLLILTAFISILTVFSRYWRDSEMAVWLSCGLSLRQWIMPLMVFVLPFAALTAAISLWASPWAEARGASFAQFLKQKQDMTLVEEGIFRVQDKDGSVYFVESFDAEQGVAKNVFLRSTDAKTRKTVVTLAQRGVLREDGNTRILTLNNGYRYSGMPGQADFERVRFDRADLIVAVTPKVVNLEEGRKTAMPAQLWASDKNDYRAELMWRLSMPLVVPILALLALALSYYNPRSGRTYNILLAVVFFFVYQNALTFMRARISSGQLDFWTGLLPVHLLMLAVAALFLYYRNQPTRFARKAKS